MKILYSNLQILTSLLFVYYIIAYAISLNSDLLFPVVLTLGAKVTTNEIQKTL